MRQLQINIRHLFWTSESTLNDLAIYALQKNNQVILSCHYFKNFKKWSRMFLELWNHTFVVDPSWFWNDWMKTVADAILSYYILYHYFKISKIYQNFMRPSNKAQALMLIYYRRAPHNFKTIEWKL